MTENSEQLANNKRMAVACVCILLGTLIMPHDSPVATIVSKYIFPATVSGVLFGIAICIGYQFANSKGLFHPHSTERKNK